LENSEFGFGLFFAAPLDFPRRGKSALHDESHGYKNWRSMAVSLIKPLFKTTRNQI